MFERWVKPFSLQRLQFGHDSQDCVCYLHSNWPLHKNFALNLTKAASPEETVKPVMDY